MQEMAVNGQLTIVERTKMWAEYKEKKIKDAQSEREKQSQEKQECTFKPQINNYFSRKTQQQYQDNSQVANKGLDKYLQRMDKAKELKEEKQKLEDQLFKKTSNWKPKLTTPQEPKLSAYLNKQDVNVKALNKPVNIYRGQQNYSNERRSYGDESNNSPNRTEFSPNQITKTKDFIQLAQRCKEQFVEIRHDMNYDEAVSLIHQHILSLDI